MPSAQEWAGISQGLANVSQQMQTKPLRDARLAEAQSKQTLAEEQLTDYQGRAPLRKSQESLELEQTRQQLKSMQANGLKQGSFSAFDRYEADKDVKHLNNWLGDAKRTNIGARLHQDVVRLDKLTRTPQTETMLRQAGIQDIDGFFENPDENGNFVVATGPDGKQSLKNMDNVYKAMGYTQYADKQVIDKLTLRSQRQQLEQSGMLYKDMTAMERSARMVQKSMGIPYHEALEMVRKGTSKTGSSALERIAQRLQEDNPDMSWPVAMEEASMMMRVGGGSALERETKRIMDANPDMKREDAMIQAKKAVQPATSAQRNIQEAKDVRTALIKQGIYTKDLTNRQTRREMGPLIADLEKLMGVELDAEEKRTVRNMRELTMLGGKAGEALGPEETGVLDNMFNKFKRYVSDNVPSTVATAAYETFRNSMRHALYGSALSQAEINAFNSAAGTLGQQAGPVLQQLATQMHTIKSQLQSVYDMNDEMVAEYRLGASLEDIDKALEQMDVRISMITQQSGKRVSKKELKTAVPPGERQSLDDIFGGVNR